MESGRVSCWDAYLWHPALPFIGTRGAGDTALNNAWPSLPGYGQLEPCCAPVTRGMGGVVLVVRGGVEEDVEHCRERADPCRRL